MGGWRGGGQILLSLGRDVPSKGFQFSESIWSGGIFRYTKLGKVPKYNLSGKGPLLVWKGVVSKLPRTGVP